MYKPPKPVTQKTLQKKPSNYKASPIDFQTQTSFRR